MAKKNRIDLKQYRTAYYLRWVIWQFDLRSNYGSTLIKRGPCPLCSDHVPTSRNLAVDIPNGVWFCHGCKASGDAITLYSRLAEVTCWEAAIELSRLTKTPVPWLSDDPQTLTNPEISPTSTAPEQTFGKNQSTLDGPLPQAESVTDFQQIMGRDPSKN